MAEQLARVGDLEIGRQLFKSPSRVFGNEPPIIVDTAQVKDPQRAAPLKAGDT